MSRECYAPARAGPTYPFEAYHLMGLLAHAKIPNFHSYGDAIFLFELGRTAPPGATVVLVGVWQVGHLSSQRAGGREPVSTPSIGEYA